MKTKSNQKEEDPNQPSGQGIHRNTGDVGSFHIFLVYLLQVSATT